MQCASCDFTAQVNTYVHTLYNYTMLILRGGGGKAYPTQNLGGDHLPPLPLFCFPCCTSFSLYLFLTTALWFLFSLLLLLLLLLIFFFLYFVPFLWSSLVWFLYPHVCASLTSGHNMFPHTTHETRTTVPALMMGWCHLWPAWLLGTCHPPPYDYYRKRRNFRCGLIFVGKLPHEN